jgi:hypothetical protein
MSCRTREEDMEKNEYSKSPAVDDVDPDADREADFLKRWNLPRRKSRWVRF